MPGRHAVDGTAAGQYSFSAMRYRLIGIDLDDTLLNTRRLIAEEDRAAIGRARQAGAMVVPCTGRTWHKAMEMALGDVPGLEAGVFLDGAMICEVGSGRMLRSTAMPDHLSAG